ncbi:GntR family transcriptional regulator, partial [Defluviitalea phaphyphila]|uniref:GntR family transcriptional regulator n=1 Tax=Defluviitalea phaphyphila TaxID=1473580 RepID=UPI0009FD923D
RLIAEEFVENRPRKGIFAAEISKKDLYKMLDVRVALETLAVTECCKLITDEQMNELKQLYKDYTEKLNSGEYAKASQLDSQIHKYIAIVTNNQKLVTYISEIEDIFAYTRPCNVKWTKTKINRSIRDHKNLIEAIFNRDEERAMDLVREDIEAMRDLLKQNEKIS